MKKQTKLHSIKLLSLAIVAAITIIGATFSAMAQNQPTFKVGARSFDGQAAQLLVRCAALNRMTHLGMPASYAA